MLQQLFSHAGSLVVPAAGTLSAYAATTGPVADNTSPRSITLWKYEVKDLSELGDRGDGEMDDTVTKTPLAGIKFRIQRVTAIGDAALTNPLDQKEGTDYTIDKHIYCSNSNDRSRWVCQSEFGVAAMRQMAFI